LKDRSVQDYELLIEDPEMKKMESQLQESQHQAFIMQAQMKLLTTIEKMKISQEQRAFQQDITTIHERVMEFM
jgi:hypothetical protein